MFKILEKNKGLEMSPFLSMSKQNNSVKGSLVWLSMPFPKNGVVSFDAETDTFMMKMDPQDIERYKLSMSVKREHIALNTDRVMIIIKHAGSPLPLASASTKRVLFSSILMKS